MGVARGGAVGAGGRGVGGVKGGGVLGWGERRVWTSFGGGRVTTELFGISPRRCKGLVESGIADTRESGSGRLKEACPVRIPEPC